MLSNYCNLMNYNPPIIFPPINHENLHISSDPSLIPKQIPQIHASVDQQYAYSNSDSDSDSDSDSIANSMSSSTFSPSNSTPIPHSPLFASPKAKPEAIYLDSWTRVLHTKFSCIMRFIWGSSRGLLWSFRSATIAAVLIAFLYFRQRRRLREVESSKARLLGIIVEKDEVSWVFFLIIFLRTKKPV